MQGGLFKRLDNAGFGGMTALPAATLSFVDGSDSINQLGKGDSLRSRGGLRIEKLDAWKKEDGLASHLQLYGFANLSYEFLDGTSAEVDSTETEQTPWWEANPVPPLARVRGISRRRMGRAPGAGSQLQRQGSLLPGRQ